MNIDYRLIIATLFIFSSTFLCGQAEKTWDLFKNETFRDVEVEEFLSVASVMNNNDHLKSIDGTQITIRGYHIPVMEDDIIILSKYPNANCFFCGGAGMESIMEIRIKAKKHRHFAMDEKLTFTGKLKVNTTEWEYVSLILEDAVLVE